MGISIETSYLMSICTQLMDGHVSYSAGAKAPHLDYDAAKITKIDCSGFVQYVLYQASNKAVILKSGSWFQNEWCKTQRLEKVDYSTAGQSDGWLRLGYFPSPSAGKLGHIWLILDGMTLESRGGKGPDRRSWDENILKKSVKSCYKLAQTFTQHENNFYVGMRYYA